MAPPRLYGESPRLVAFGGLVIIACASRSSSPRDPSPHWIAPLAVGIVPLTWARRLAGDRIAGLLSIVAQQPVYRASRSRCAPGWQSLPRTHGRVPYPLHPAAQALHVEDYLLACPSR